MKEELRYVTWEEQKMYEKLAREYGIKGYSCSTFMIRCKIKEKQNGRPSKCAV